jgi:hypothetical protein
MGYIYIERRGMGRMQSRLGPNRTGPFGLLQAVADVDALGRADLAGDDEVAGVELLL